MDKDFIPGLMYIRDNEATSEEFEAMSLPFTVPSASGQDIQLSSKYTHITLDNRAEYVRLAINYRCVLTWPLRSDSGQREQRMVCVVAGCFWKCHVQ